MSTKINLINMAIRNAKDGDWKSAIENNLEIIKVDPENVNALNRLGVALVQIDQTNKAKNYFKQALKIDINNKIAKNT